MNLQVVHLKIIAHDSLLRNIGSFLGDLSPLIVNFDDRIAPIRLSLIPFNSPYGDSQRYYGFGFVTIQTIVALNHGLSHRSSHSVFDF